jgi:hypothetical protein
VVVAEWAENQAQDIINILYEKCQNPLVFAGSSFLHLEEEFAAKK